MHIVFLGKSLSRRLHRVLALSDNRSFCYVNKTLLYGPSSLGVSINEEIRLIALNFYVLSDTERIHIAAYTFSREAKKAIASPLSYF